MASSPENTGDSILDELEKTGGDWSIEGPCAYTGCRVSIRKGDISVRVEDFPIRTAVDKALKRFRKLDAVQDS